MKLICNLRNGSCDNRAILPSGQSLQHQTLFMKRQLTRDIRKIARQSASEIRASFAPFGYSASSLIVCFVSSCDGVGLGISSAG